MIDRRQKPRTRSLLSGSIVLNERESAMDCSVRNVSEGGALIVCSEMFRMPDAFDLMLPMRNETHRAEIVWRRNDRAGLAITPAAERPPRREKRGVWMRGSRRWTSRGFAQGFAQP